MITHRGLFILKMLKAVKDAKDKSRIVYLNTIAGLNAYHSQNDDYLIFSATVTDKLENDWIGSVLVGKPITPPFGFIPSITADEIESIYAEIEARI